MARVVVTSWAYLGDVAPYIEPARRLAARGHDVTFLTAAGYEPVLAGEAFRFLPYAIDFSSSAMHADAAHERLMRHPFRNQVRLGRYWMRRGLLADPAAARASMLAAFDGADVVVTHPTVGSATIPAAHHLGVPVVVGHLFPMMMATAAWTPSLPVRHRDLGARVNGGTWRGMAALSGATLYDRRMNAYRRDLGSAARRGVALDAWSAAERTVVLVSRHYFGDPAPDWDVPMVGFSPWTGPLGRAETPPEVEELLGDGDPPVLVCLGTSAASGAGDAFATIAGGLDRLGMRSLLLVGDAANLRQLAGHPGAVAFAPVPAVVGRCRIAVVSGALGTLAASLSAGVPVVVLPQLFDQLWHGARVEDLGVGIMVRRPSQVADAVARIVADPRYATRAGELAAAMADEDGAGALADAVESLLAGR